MLIPKRTFLAVAASAAAAIGLISMIAIVDAGSSIDGMKSPYEPDYDDKEIDEEDIRRKLQGAYYDGGGYYTNYYANNIFKRTKRSKNAKKNRGQCVAPPPGSPNHMYDNYAIQACANVDMDLWNIESAAFRMITTQSVRLYRNQTFCYPFSPSSTSNPAPIDNSKITGIPYKYWNWVVQVISLLDLIKELQLVPRSCMKRQDPLRELLLPGRNEALLPDIDYAIGMQADNPPSYTFAYDWWEKTFLPTTAETFSCGFVEGVDTVEDRNILTEDIRDYFANDRTIQQSWRLVKGYLRSPQKQRERGYRNQDFDLSLYVPFLPVPEAKVVAGEVPRPDGSRGGSIRTGFPTYQGPSIWYLFHTIAARFYEMDQRCSPSGRFTQSSNAKLAQSVVNLVSYFGLVGPCPYCRYHFMQRVSRNDMNWLDLDPNPKVPTNLGNKQYGKKYDNVTNAFTKSVFVSENDLYPLEYMFLNPKGPTIKDKLDTVTDGKSLMFMFWKLHNTVTSSVVYGFQCRTEEVSDKFPYYCNIAAATKAQGVELAPNEFQIKNLEQFYNGANQSTTTVNEGRAWPTSQRWQFWLNKDTSAFDNARKQLEGATAKLKALDGKYGTRIRQLYWTADSDTYLTAVDQSSVNQILAAIKELDAAMDQTNLLYTEYKLDAAPNCRRFANSMKKYQPLNAVLPLTPEGNFPWFPDVCYPSNSEPKLDVVVTNEEYDGIDFADEEERRRRLFKWAEDED